MQQGYSLQTSVFSCGFSSIELHHPELASSSEGLALEETTRSLNAEAELDLLVMADGQRLVKPLKFFLLLSSPAAGSV